MIRGAHGTSERRHLGDGWFAIRIWRPEEKLGLKFEILGDHSKSNADESGDYGMLWKRRRMVLAERVMSMSLGAPTLRLCQSTFSEAGMCHKTNPTHFLVPTAYKIYVDTTPQSIKCALA